MKVEVSKLLMNLKYDAQYKIDASKKLELLKESLNPRVDLCNYFKL